LLREKRRVIRNNNEERIKNYLSIPNQIIYIEVINNKMGSIIREIVKYLLGFGI
jgi:hypothetical protein